MKTAVVVGGGIAGVVAAMVLRQKYKVVLIERSSECGGLLRSVSYGNQYYFDMGTHVLSDTGVPELDRMLYGWLPENLWNRIDVLKTGNYFARQLFPHNQYVNAASLPSPLYQQGFFDLLNTEPDQESQAANCMEYCIARFGRTFAEAIYRPVIRKLSGNEPENLHPYVVSLYNLQRLIVANRHVSSELKKSDFYDAKLSYFSYSEGVSSAKKYYPNNGKGIGQWMNGLERRLEAEGVNIRTGSQIKRIIHQEGLVNALELSTGEILTCDKMVWTIPASFLASLAELGLSFRKPQLRSMSLHHFVFDEPFQVDNHYLYCWEETFNTFRITLYPNMIAESGASPAHHQCTVEVFSDGSDLQVLRGQAEAELRAMGVVPASATVSLSESQQVLEGFPLMTHDFVNDTAEANSRIGQAFHNVLLLGKAAGGAFFMNDVMVHAYRESMKFAEEEVE